MKAIINVDNQLVLMSETLQEDIVLQGFLRGDQQPMQIVPFQMTQEQMQPPPEPDGPRPGSVIPVESEDIVQKGFDEIEEKILESIAESPRPRRTKK